MDSDYETREETLSVSSRDKNLQQRKPHKGGKIIREELISMSELHACPLATSCFKHQSCFGFCEMVEKVKFHHELARLFVTNLDNNVVNLVGVTFNLSPTIISEAIGIPNVGKKWNKRQNIDRDYYEPYIKAKYHSKISRVFPFKFLEDKSASLMKVIIKYFTCEGRFSKLYAYHIRLLMHFTKVKMMSIHYFIRKNIEKMELFVKEKPYP